MWVFRQQNMNMKHLIFFYKDVFFLLPHVYKKTKIKVKFFKNTLKNLTVDLYDLVREINII